MTAEKQARRCVNERQIVRLLIVDGHPIIRDALADLVSRKTADTAFECVASAGRAEDALARIQSESPDVVIVEIALEGMDGIELIKMIRARKYTLKILVLSLYDERLYAERALEAGADGYVMKRQTPSDIFNAICAVAQGNIYFSNRVLKKLAKRLTSAASASPATVLDSLTDRELETFRLFGAGWTAQHIANELHVSIKTVAVYSKHIRAKLNLESVNELIVHATQWINSRALEQNDGHRS